MLNRLLHVKYGWAIIIIALVGINLLFSLFHFRLDLTAEKRYTLSEPTKELLRKLDDKIDITVFLDGEMPASGGPNSLFIDVIGRPLSPVSVCGVRRRERRRDRR